MRNRRGDAWDEFTTIDGERHTRTPTRWERFYVALGTLVVGLAMGYIMAHLLLGAITFGLRRGHGVFLHAPWWVHAAASVFGFGWAIVNWIRGLEEEKETRERLEQRQARSEARERRDVTGELQERMGRRRE